MKAVDALSDFKISICDFRNTIDINQGPKFKGISKIEGHLPKSETCNILDFGLVEMYIHELLEIIIFCSVDSYLLTFDCFIFLFSVCLLTIGESKTEARRGRTATSPTETRHAEEDARTAETGSYILCTRSYV